MDFSAWWRENLNTGQNPCARWFSKVISVLITLLLSNFSPPDFTLRQNLFYSPNIQSWKLHCFQISIFAPNGQSLVWFFVFSGKEKLRIFLTIFSENIFHFNFTEFFDNSRIQIFLSYWRHNSKILTIIFHGVWFFKKGDNFRTAI